MTLSPCLTIRTKLQDFYITSITGISIYYGTRRKPRDPILRCPHQTPSKCLLYTSTPQKDFHRSLHQVGPRKYKVNLIRTLTYRCFRICSTFSSLQAALSDLKKTLLLNGYPKGIISYNMNDVLNKHRNRPSQERCNPCAALLRFPKRSFKRRLK